MSRELTNKDLAYDRLAPSWESVISDFDTRRRVTTLVEKLLGREKVAGKRCLDVGCGLGYFTKALLAYGPASITAVDIAPALVERLATQCPDVTCCVADILQLSAALGEERFDVVISSEVIEHTPDPHLAFGQLASKVAPGGYLALSCPNRRWKWLLHLVKAMGMRKHYDGYENWVWPGALTAWTGEYGLSVVQTAGIHILPWHASERLVEWLDGRIESVAYPWSVNLAILAKRA